MTVKRMIRGVCNHPDCGAHTMFVIGDKDPEAALLEIGRSPSRECLSGPLPHMPHGETYFSTHTFTRDCDGSLCVFEEEVEEPPTDEDFKAELEQGNPGCRVLMTSEFPSGLRHLGFGEFESETYRYVRHDSPRRKRFYVEVPRG